MVTNEMLESRRERLYASLLQIQGALDCINELIEASNVAETTDEQSETEEA